MEKNKRKLRSMVTRMKKVFKLIEKEKNILENILEKEETKIYILPSGAKHLKLLRRIILKFHHQILCREKPYESFDCCELREEEWKAFRKLCEEIGLKTKVVKIPYDQGGEEEILTIELL